MSSDYSKPIDKHPYLPRDLSLPHYIANVNKTTYILAILAFVTGIIVAISWHITGRRAEPFCFRRRLVLVWFMLCAFIHIVIEGYFALYHATLAGHTSILGEMWKEYGHCDSRYISSDTFTVCMETITAAIDGPLAFITFIAFFYGADNRYFLQLLLSVLQLYGDVLYFTTEIKEGFIHGHTDDPLYFYFYFLFLNSLWIIIPLFLIVDAYRHIISCQRVSDYYMDEYNKKMEERRRKLLTRDDNDKIIARALEERKKLH